MTEKPKQEIEAWVAQFKDGSILQKTINGPFAKCKLVFLDEEKK